jgi:hypothetical protein
MATLSTAWPTLLDVANRLDPNGSIAQVAEILTQYNEVLDDIAWVEGNLPTGHKTTIRSSIPAGTWRLLNQGITPVKSQANQIIETCGMLENYSEVDKALAQLNGNSAAWRLSEDKAIIEGISQSLSTALIYGDTSVNPERFIGLAPRYYTLSGSNVSDNVINAGGSGSDNTSIWLVGWSDHSDLANYIALRRIATTTEEQWMSFFEDRSAWYDNRPRKTAGEISPNAPGLSSPDLNRSTPAALKFKILNLKFLPRRPPT